MKKLATLLAVLTCAAAMTLPALAAESGKNVGEVPISADTIAIDGKMDKVYEQALTVTVDSLGSETSNKSDVTAKAYVLWNGDKTLYCYAEIKDTTLVPYNDSNYKSAPWTSDSLEWFFDFDNDGKNRDQYRIDANGYPSYYDSASKITELDKYGFDAYAVTKTKNGYAVEFQVTSYKTVLAIGSKVGMDWQVNDMKDATTRSTIHYASSQKANGSVGKMDYVTLGAKKVAAPVVTTAITQKPSATGTSAATFDAAIVLAMVASMAGAGVVVIKRKH